jgi:hypothetical protein
MFEQTLPINSNLLLFFMLNLATILKGKKLLQTSFQKTTDFEGVLWSETFAPKQINSFPESSFSLWQFLRKLVLIVKVDLFITKFFQELKTNWKKCHRRIANWNSFGNLSWSYLLEDLSIKNKWNLKKLSVPFT